MVAKNDQPPANERLRSDPTESMVPYPKDMPEFDALSKVLHCNQVI
jgi:hypothetical protein